MLNKKNTKTSTLLIVAGLMILSVLLAACDTDAGPAETPFGLRVEESDTPIEAGSANGQALAGPAGSNKVEAPIGNTAERASESNSNIVPAGRDGNGNQARTTDRTDHVFDPNTAAALSAAEMESLTHMREEEKLARDVYLALYEQWGIPIFQNIAGSEQTHMDSILMLLEQYELTDPAAGLAAGEFANPIFQSLYAQLVEQGTLSPADALIVGATIEDLDIFDLQEYLAQTNNEYLVQVYGNLLAGSENHLRAFVSNLERQTGEGYQPVYLDQDAYQAIIDGATGRGGGNGGYGGGNAGGGNGNGGGGNGGYGNGGGRNGQNSNA